MLILTVGGVWGPDAKSSSAFMQLVAGVQDAGQSTVHYNGGPLDNLTALSRQVDRYDAIIWMPQVPNDVPKLLPALKQRAPTSLLVCGRRMDTRHQDLVDVIDRAQEVRADLTIAHTWIDNRFSALLLDPQGNVLIESTDFHLLGLLLGKRLQILRSVAPITREMK